MSGLSDSFEKYAADELLPYRAVSKTAVLSFALSICGLLGLLFPTMLLASLVGFVFGVVSLSRFRKYPGELSARWAARVGTIACACLFVGGLTTHIIIYMTEVPEGYTRVKFSQLKRAEKSKPDQEKLMELHEGKAFIKGYCHPGVDGLGEVYEFVLVGDMRQCCFGGQPEMYDMVEVKLQTRRGVEYSRRVLRLGGIFRIGQEIRLIGDIESGRYKLEVDYLK